VNRSILEIISIVSLVLSAFALLSSLLLFTPALADIAKTKKSNKGENLLIFMSFYFNNKHKQEKLKQEKRRHFFYNAASFFFISNYEILGVLFHLFSDIIAFVAQPVNSFNGNGF